MTLDITNDPVLLVKKQYICLRFMNIQVSAFEAVEKSLSFMLFNELLRFLSEIETDNLTVSNSEIITLDFTV